MGAARARRRIPSWLPQAAGCALSVASLGWVLNRYPLSELVASIRSLDFRWVAIAVAADLATYVSHGWRWNTLLEPVARLRLWRTVQAIYIGLYANEIFPLRVGELLRCWLLTHWNDLRLSMGLASAAVERLIDGFWLLLAFLITVGFVKTIPRDLVILAQAIGVLLLASAIGLVWVVGHKQKAHAAIREGRWAAALRHAIEGLHLMGNPRTLGLTAFISLVYLLLQYFTVYALMKAYGLDFSFWMACGVLTITRLAVVIPNAPGNVGLFQAACVLSMRLFDVEKNDATGFSFILWGAMTLPLLAGGAIATALTGTNIGELHSRARSGLAAQSTAPPV
jgi:glycosyltransferase 2 family protein